MKDGFYIMIETYHLADKGDTPNAHELPKDKLEKREVVPIDIANDPVAPNDYKVRKQKPGKKLHVFPPPYIGGFYGLQSGFYSPGPKNLLPLV